MAEWSVAIEGAILAALSILMLLKASNSTSWTLGFLWMALALFDFGFVTWPDAAVWNSFGSYFLFIAAMLWIGFTGRMQKDQSPAPSRR